jgi:thymidylate synthase
MKHIKVRNVNEAYCEGFWHLKTCGEKQTSRNGEVIVAPGPVLTEYLYPMERVLFNAERDANPVFHLMEAIWMLSGSNEVGFLLPFNSKFGQYAEEDGRVWGAYGHRWIRHFGIDQIKGTINLLLAHPDTRRAVIGMWSPEYDLGANVADVPCNTTVFFDLIGNRLNMTVCCRSNDMVWGAYGANAVHFSMLQELISSAVGVEMGVYRQFSNNFHAYTALPLVEKSLIVPPTYHSNSDEYTTQVTWMPMLIGGVTWQDFMMDCRELVRYGGRGVFETQFFRELAVPLHQLYLERKGAGMSVKVPADLLGTDWGLAFQQWLDRRA